MNAPTDQLPSAPSRAGVVVEMATTFAIAGVLLVGFHLLITSLPHCMVRDTFDGMYQYMTVFLLFWHLLLLGFRAWLVWRPEYRAMQQDWLPGSGPLTQEGVREAANKAHAWEAVHGHSLISRRLVLLESHLSARGDTAELSNLLQRRAEADHARTEDAYALPRFLFWAIPILGFIGTVVGIGGAIAGLKTGDITSAEVLRDQIGHVAGSLGTAFYATQVALILSVIALLAQTVLYQSEMRLHDAAEDLLTYQLEGRLSVERSDQAGLIEAMNTNAKALAEDAQRRDQATRAHVQALMAGHEQLSRALGEIAACASSASTVAQQAHQQIAEQAGTLSLAIRQAVATQVEVQAQVTRVDLGRVVSGLVEALKDDHQRRNQELATRETVVVDALVRQVAQANAPMAAAVERAIAQVEAAIRSFNEARERDSVQQARQATGLDQSLAGLQQTLVQLPVVIHKQAAESSAPMAAVMERSVAQIEAAFRSLQEMRQAEAAQQALQVAGLDRSLTGLQETLRLLPPAIQTQLSKPIQLQLSLTPLERGPSGAAG